jgi:hypothetical protein
MGDRLHRIACIALAITPLAGCGIFESVTMAAYAVNGVSYASTGKSVMDHAASYGTGRDCALLRAARDEDICRDSEGSKPDKPIDPLETIAPASTNWMLVLGTYSDSREADDELRRYRSLEPFLVSEQVDGRPVRRIVAGPYAERDLKLYRSLARQAGAVDALPVPAEAIPPRPRS